MGCRVRDCCRSVDCRASRLSEWVLCLVCDVVGLLSVVWTVSKLSVDDERLMGREWQEWRRREVGGEVAVVEWKRQWWQVAWAVVCVGRAEVDVSEAGASVAAEWDQSRASFDIAVWLLATKHTG